jgi:hypothetical protein
MGGSLKHQIWSGAIFLLENPQAQAVFDVIANDLGISGYGVAKKLDLDPKLVQQSLSSLREKHLVSGGSALTENYTLADVGFEVRAIG